MDQISITIVCAMIQMVGVGVLTGLLALMAQSLKLPYLRQWALGWAWLSGALVALQLVFRFPVLVHFLQPLYHFGGIAFLWMLRQGWRSYRGAAPERPGLLAVASGIAYSLVLPHLFGDFTGQFVVHALVFSAGMAFLAWGGCGDQVFRDAEAGGQLTRAGLLLLFGLFGFHALVLGLLRPMGMRLPAVYAQFTSLYDFLGEVTLAFGLLVTATQDASSRIHTLTRLLPICAWCRKIRDDHGFWTEFEQWVRAQGGAEITHGICPECHRKAFPECHEPQADGGDSTSA